MRVFLSENTMAPHSSTLAWKIPWTEEPGRLQSMGSLRVGYDWATSLSLFAVMHWRRKWQPTQCSCLENPRDGGSWWAAVYGVSQSWTRLKWLSSSRASLSFSEWRLLSSCGVQASHCCVFSYGGAQALGAQASVVEAHGLSSCTLRTL